MYDVYIAYKHLLYQLSYEKCCPAAFCHFRDVDTTREVLRSSLLIKSAYRTDKQQFVLVIRG